MRRFALIPVLVALVSACGGGSGPKHIEIKINGTTITTTSAAVCAKMKSDTAKFNAYNAGVTAWSALSQAERDASHSPTDPPEVYQANWMRAHGYPTVPPAKASGVIAVDCTG